MTSSLAEVHLWSLKNQTSIPGNDIGFHAYHEKTENVEYLYNEEKIQYTESRDCTWTPKNKRPDKLRDTLKELEELLLTCRCVQSKWITRRLLQMFLSNGAVILLLVSQHTGDVDRIFIDKSLVGRLSGDNPSCVLMCDGFFVIAYPDKPKLEYVYLMKKPPTGEAIRKFEKLSNCDPRISLVDLPGPVGRRLNRQLHTNLHQDMILVWWPTASEEAWPWSPMTGDKERANLVLFAASGPKLEMMSYTRTENEPVGVQFSLAVQPHHILTVEQGHGTSTNDVPVELCMYENSRNRIQRLTVTTIPLKATVQCYDRNMTEDKVLLGCKDGTMVLYDEYRKQTQTCTAAFVPNHIKWHTSGVIAVAAGKKGQFQVFDMSLAPLLIQLVGENYAPTPSLELTSYFRSTPSLEQIHWSPMLDQAEIIAECTDSLFMVYDRGPVGLLQYHLGVVSQGQLTPLLLVNEYVKHRQIDEAINLLGGLNWNIEGAQCFACLSAIVNHLLKMSLNPVREAQLESALGTFYNPVKPLSEVTVLEYRDPLSRLARRFFHHLLRFTRFDKAFLLAVDIGARDLFMDIHYLARDKGEMALAEVAKRRAEQIDSESLGNESVDDFEDEISEDGEDSLDELYEEDDASQATSGYSDERIPPRPYRVPWTSSGKGIPPSSHMYAVPPSDTRFLPRMQHSRPLPPRQPWEQPYMDLPESALQQLEKELSSQMLNEYTASLLDEIPPPQVADEEDEDSQEGDGTKSVKVIHFGLV